MPHPNEPPFTNRYRRRPPPPNTVPYANSVYAQIPRQIVLEELPARLIPPAAQAWIRFPASMKTQYISEVFRRTQHYVDAETHIADAFDLALTDVARILNKLTAAATT